MKNESVYLIPEIVVIVCEIFPGIIENDPDFGDKA